MSYTQVEFFVRKYYGLLLITLLLVGSTMVAFAQSDSERGIIKSDKLKGKRVAILCTNGVEMLELTEPRAALEAAGAETILIAPAAGKITAWDMVQWSKEFSVDIALSEAAKQAEKGEYDALLLPGGPLNADVLRSNDFAVFFVKEFFLKPNKPVAVLCHAPWMLAEADVLKGRTITSYPAIATDLRNAGAIWVNKAVVQDGNLVTGRQPADTPQFNPVMVELFANATTATAQQSGE